MWIRFEEPGGGTTVTPMAVSILRVECPFVGRTLPPQSEGVTAVGSSVLVRHAGDGARGG